ncbi:hypothetical protein A0H76_3078 [Hepatospora eriocheir]|uniref:Uncharacterized protein n=1 Tax=Hepatospora eriocheir TaxID=1081669 RepID=A0A1X0Q5G2_9MICR|nr:hypothetical protein A0H76_3078 [Hepatospora eriocheir]
MILYLSTCLNLVVIKCHTLFSLLQTSYFYYNPNLSFQNLSTLLPKFFNFGCLTHYLHIVNKKNYFSAVFSTFKKRLIYLYNSPRVS